MESNIKKEMYESPSMQIVEMHTKGDIAIVVVSDYEGFDSGSTPGEEMFTW